MDWAATRRLASKESRSQRPVVRSCDVTALVLVALWCRCTHEERIDHDTLEDPAGGDDQLPHPAHGPGADRPLWSTADRVAQSEGGRRVGGQTARSWGLQNGRMEPWDWGNPGWLNERLSAHIISPVKDHLVAEALGWTPGTNGPVGAAVQITLPTRPTKEELAAHLDALRSAVEEDRARWRASAGVRDVQRHAGAPRRSRRAADSERTAGRRARRAAIHAEASSP